jgi:hypothetical protein
MPVDSPFVMAGNAPLIPGCRDLSLIGERVARSLFSAHSDRVGRPVTVTVFPPLSEGRTSRGFDEAAAVAQRLGAHPSVLTIHEWGHADDGRPWIVTEPQPAESVDTLLTMDGPLDVELALQVGVLLAGALETAHRAGIVHGDLQPARLVFGAHGEPLLVETGLAGFAVFPGLGALNNPVRYFAPPEVLERTDTTTATDVYSLGTTVYAMLAGRAPQQKPAEITDSNASLLLRILQMSVPPIDRPDLPAGLQDALRGPLSPTPARRPQRAIDVAWMLQDVQRNAGFAVTEPVVLDLDAGGDRVATEVRATAGAGGSPLAPAVHPAQADAVHSPAVAPEHAGAAPPADRWAPDDSPPDPWGPRAVLADAPADPWGPGAVPDDAPADPWGPGAVPADPLPDFPDEVVPPPTIFPFAEGLDDMLDRGIAASAATPWTDASEAGTPDPGSAELSLWSPPPTDGATEQSLWPSSWPADHAQGDLPSWAAPTPDDSGDTRAGAAPVGGLGGPIGDLAPTGHNGHANGNGAAVDHGLVPSDLPAAPAAPAAPSAPSEPESRAVLPPELDELPSWYTDPLPNEGARGGTNGADLSSAGGAHGAPWSASPVPEPDDLWPPESLAGGDSAGFPAPPVDERLPGSGDELRSLFGDVVRDPEVGASARPALAAGPAIGPAPAPPDTDPLGPPSDRPPIDLSRLDTPLGPAPFLPARGGNDPAGDRAGGGRPGGDQSARLPRRHEVATRSGPEGLDGIDGALPARLPRADEAYPARAHDDEPAPRAERSVPRQVAPDPNRVPAAGGAASAGPPALPVIILIGVVAILLLGVAWLVITGDDAEAPASDRPAATDDADADADAGRGGAGAAAGSGGAPTAVTAAAVPEGIQVSWAGAADATYIVTVLSPDQPPQALPPTLGASVLVPNVELASGGGRCFTVATAPDAQGVPGTPSAPACTPDVTVEGMQQAAPPA